MSSDDFDFSGIWHSTYHYTSTSKPGNFTSEYDVEIHRAGNQLVIQSTSPDKEAAYILLRLTMDERILTGTWHEQTSDKGDYGGEAYYGALQLVIEDDGNAIRGMGVGFNRKMGVQSLPWEIVRTDER